MKTVFILTNSLQSGGAEKQSILLGSALNEHHKVSLIVFASQNISDPKLLSLLKQVKIRAVFIEGNKLVQIYRFISIVLKEKPTVFFSYLAFTNVINGILGALLGVDERYGGIRNAFVPSAKLKLQKIIHNNLLTASISNSTTGRLFHFNRGFKKKPIEVIYNSILNVGPPIERIGYNEINILSVGRFVEQKDYYTSLTAFEKTLNNKNLQTELNYTIIGYGPEEMNIRKFIEKHNLNQHVNVIINPPFLESYYERADIFLVSSLFEGLSNSILEAMSYSLPIIATDAGDNKYLVENAINGYIIASRDHENMSDVLIKLSNDPLLRKKMGKSSYQKIIEDFSFEKFRDQYLSLLS